MVAESTVSANVPYGTFSTRTYRALVPWLGVLSILASTRTYGTLGRFRTLIDGTLVPVPTVLLSGDAFNCGV